MKEENTAAVLDMLEEEIKEKGYTVFSSHFQKVETVKGATQGGFEIVIEDCDLNDEQYSEIADAEATAPDGYKDGCTIIAYTLSSAVKLISQLPEKKG